MTARASRAPPRPGSANTPRRCSADPAVR
jgi:hypothetical protein